MSVVGKFFQIFFALFIGSILLAVFLYLPYIKASIKYTWARKDYAIVVKEGNPIEGLRNTIIANDTKFGIVIPKLGINSSVVANVDLFDKNSYREAFKTGIAHSHGSSVPGKGGNIILFSHVPGNIREVQKYNLPFYFLNHLVQGDVIYVYYKEKQYRYEVTGANVVNEMDVNFYDLVVNPKVELLSIITLWPPGTSMSRYIVDAKKI